MSPWGSLLDLVLPGEVQSGVLGESGVVIGRAALVLLVAASVLVTIFACWVGGADFLLLVGDHVLQPTDASLLTWSLGVLGCAGSFVTVLACRRVGSAGHETGGAVLGGLVAVALVGTGMWCAGRAFVIHSAAALGPDAYTVLRPPAEAGCPLVAHETTELRSSSGDLYIVSPLGYAQLAGSWRANEIQLPVRDGNYSLQWHGEVGTFVLRGSRGIWPDRLQLSCIS